MTNNRCLLSMLLVCVASVLSARAVEPIIQTQSVSGAARRIMDPDLEAQLYVLTVTLSDQAKLIKQLQQQITALQNDNFAARVKAGVAKDPWGNKDTPARAKSQARSKSEGRKELGYLVRTRMMNESGTGPGDWTWRKYSNGQWTKERPVRYSFSTYQNQSAGMIHAMGGACSIGGS